MNQRLTFITAIIFGGLAVGLGAFGAHALEIMLAQRNRTDTWDLAVQYQMIHALVLLINGLMLKENLKSYRIAAILFTAGVLCFSGSLFVLCLTDILFPLVLITPLGGVMLIAGWISMLAGVIQKKPGK